MSLLFLLPLGLGPELSGQEVSESGAPQDVPLPTMRAHRVSAPIVVDGRLDEAVWESAPSGSSFVQKEPFEGAPALNDSEVWVLYDDEALYIGARLHDDSPSTIAANMVRRDSHTASSKRPSTTIGAETRWARIVGRGTS